jgi:hypothetical protein
VIHQRFGLMAPILLFRFLRDRRPSVRGMAPRPACHDRASRSRPRFPPRATAAPSVISPCRAATAAVLPARGDCPDRTAAPGPRTSARMVPVPQSTRTVPEEVLVVDPRVGMTPAQLVERKLIALLKGNYRPFCPGRSMTDRVGE